MAVFTTIADFILGDVFGYADANEQKENDIYLKDRLDNISAGTNLRYTVLTHVLESDWSPPDTVNMLIFAVWNRILAVSGEVSITSSGYIRFSQDFLDRVNNPISPGNAGTGEHTVSGDQVGAFYVGSE